MKKITTHALAPSRVLGLLLVFLLLPAPGWGANLHTTVASTIDALIAGKTYSTVGRRFSTEDYATQTYVQNAAYWLKDFSNHWGMAAYNSWWASGNQGNRYCAIAITPHIVLFSWHVAVGTGTHTFVKPDGTKIVVNGTTTARVGTTDLGVQLITQDMQAAGIPIFKVLDSTFYAKLITYTAGSRMPVIGMIGGGTVLSDGATLTHPNRYATVRDLNNFISSGKEVQLAVPTDSQRLAFYYDAYETGDSGNNIVVPIDGELVLLGRIQNGGAGQAPSPLNYITALNTAIGTLVAETVTVKNLSAYDDVVDQYALVLHATALDQAASYRRYNSVTAAVGQVATSVPQASDTLRLTSVALPPGLIDTTISPDPDQYLAATIVGTSGHIYDGTFSGSVTGCTIHGGIYRGPVVTSTIPTNGTFFSSLVILPTGADLSHATKFSLDGGTSWLSLTSVTTSSGSFHAAR